MEYILHEQYILTGKPGGGGYFFQRLCFILTLIKFHKKNLILSASVIIYTSVCVFLLKIMILPLENIQVDLV